MVFNEKVEKILLDTFTPNDQNDGYHVWDTEVEMLLQNDPDKDKIVETINKIVSLINESDKQTQIDLIDKEISDLIDMV